MLENLMPGSQPMLLCFYGVEEPTNLCLNMLSRLLRRFEFGDHDGKLVNLPP